DGGLSWKYVHVKVSSATTNLPQLNGVWTTQPDKAVIIGNNGYVANIGGSGGTALTFNTSFSTNKNLNAIALHKETGFIVGANGTAYKTIDHGMNWSVLNSSNTITTNLKAIHIFQDNKFMAVGNQGSIYCFNGAWIKHDPPTTVNTPSANAILVHPATIFTDVFFHDDRTGYVVGSGGPGIGSYVLRCGESINIQKFTAATGTSMVNPSIWIPKDLTGINGVNSSLNVDVATVDFANRYHGFLGGSFNSGTQVNYARLVNDETNMFSTRFWYDRLGRMVVSQNTKQFNRRENTIPKGLADYSYTLYDDLGRISEVGEVSDNAGVTANFSTIFGEYINGKFNPNVINDIKLNAWVNASNRREVTKTYYDQIVIIGLPIIQENLRKRVATVTYEDVYDHNDQTFQHGTHYTYDIHGNVNTLLQDNQRLYDEGVASASLPIQAQRFKRIDYEYDLISGKVNLVRFQDGQPDAFYHFYRYDADNRITDVYTSQYPQANTLINEDVVLHHPLWTMDAQYNYYAHGPLARVEYGDIDNKVQGTDYAYTLQGWIKGVNSNLLKSETDIGNDGLSGGVHSKVAKDAFSYTLNYHADDYQPIDISKWNNPATRFKAITANSDLMAARHDLYNGNISSMVTTIEEPKVYTGAPNEMPNILPQGTAYQYDQLNRLLEMKAFQNLEQDPTSTSYNKWGQGSVYTGLYHNKFEYDANGNILKQLRADATGAIIDDLTYKYLKDATGHTSSNRLYHVNDNVSKTSFTDDIDDQGTFNASPITANLVLNNYLYDEIGNLKRDTQEEIKKIDWTVYGKIKSITRTQNSLRSELEFQYDANGNRIAKIEKPRDASGVKSKSDWITTYYSRDGQGHVMGIYKQSHGNSGLNFNLIERNLYGSSRLGTENKVVDLITVPLLDTNRILGNKHFEGSNHLGNVLSIFSNRAVPQDINNDKIVDYFQLELMSVNDFSPFGVVMDRRSYGILGRYGFNGKAKDDEIFGKMHEYDYGSRIYYPQLGKFLSVDPLVKTFPFWTGYQFAGNTPVMAIDLDGLEIKTVIHYLDKDGSIGKTEVAILHDEVIQLNGKQYAQTEIYYVNNQGKMWQSATMYEPVNSSE
ncbi:MAG: RHS repeat-associated core domain-containing protein, partial [Saprospiraceae bacterium]